MSGIQPIAAPHFAAPIARPAMLASVRSALEAQLARSAGVELIDAKEPNDGALGALDSASLRAIVAAAGGAIPVSATCGDLPLDAALLGPAMLRVAACGVDYVKLGIFGPADPQRLAQVLADLPALPGCAPGGRPARRIAVLMADQDALAWPLPLFAAHGFSGVMLDTADKQGGRLRQVLDGHALQGFVDQARRLGLLSGLAGSLQLEDIAPLAMLAPDYLGFRTALCDRSGRAGAIEPAQLARVRAALSAVCRTERHDSLPAASAEQTDRTCIGLGKR